MECDKLILQVNEGCPRGFLFTIKQKIYNTNTGDYEIKPLDLTGLTIRVEIKKAPYYKLKPLIQKDITEQEQPEIGFIQDAVNGKFCLQINQDDSIMLPHGEYALMVTIIDGDTYTHLSGNGDNYAIYRVCYQ